MNIKSKIILSALGLAIAVPAIPAAAQQAGGAIAAGAAIKDGQGGDVGTVARVDGDFYVVKTDKHEVRLPKTSFTAANGALLFGMTREQLNAAVDQQVAAAQAAVTVGAAVSGSGGTPVGTVSAVDAQYVTLKLKAGGSVRLPRSGVAPGANGLVVGATAAELEAAAAAAGATAASAEAKSE
jgi:preprotein translocase subunit YajC